jgi:hypothetical protein
VVVVVVVVVVLVVVVVVVCGCCVWFECVGVCGGGCGAQAEM